MTSLNRSIERVTSWRAIVSVLFVASVFSGVLFTSEGSLGQAVPPRVQALQMTRPVSPPPEPPVQREIRQLRRDVRANTRELERRRQIQITSESLVVLCAELKRQLDVEVNKKNPDLDVIRGLIKKIKNCEQDLEDMRKLR